MYSAINYPQQIRCPEQCCPHRIEREEDKHRVVPTAWPVIALVASADEEGSEPQLCHGANSNEGEKEWMIMSLDVWHFVKKHPRKVRGRTEMTREEGNRENGSDALGWRLSIDTAPVHASDTRFLTQASATMVLEYPSPYLATRHVLSAWRAAKKNLRGALENLHSRVISSTDTIGNLSLFTS